MLLFRDETVLLISEREAEQVLRALRDVCEGDAAVCLVNMAMCRWTAASPSRWHRVALAAGTCPTSAQSALARAVTSAQVFSGETDYICEAAADGAEGNDARSEAVVSCVFGGELSNEQAADAVEALVELRGRRQCLPGSDLEAICTDEITRAKFS